MKLNTTNRIRFHIPFWVLLQLILCIIMIVLKFQAYQYALSVCPNGTCSPNLPHGVQEAASSNLATPTSKKALEMLSFQRFFLILLYIQSLGILHGLVDKFKKCG